MTENKYFTKHSSHKTKARNTFKNSIFWLDSDHPDMKMRRKEISATFSKASMERINETVRDETLKYLRRTADTEVVDLVPYYLNLMV